MNDMALKPDAREIVIDAVFPHAPEKVWKTLTQADLVARWVKMPVKGFAAVKGTRFTYQTTPAGEWDGIIRCEILEVVPYERLVYSWKGGHEGNVGYGTLLDTRVTWTLARTQEGTRIRIVHSGFVLPRNESAFTNMSNGWKKVVGIVETVTAEQMQ
ncbi:MAG: SRPBCC domain-containing protein [Alphaproteobacteria bacterium]|nr:SRPBCC domain-containing protein [Alphaproteobacteria bacterium]